VAVTATGAFGVDHTHVRLDRILSERVHDGRVDYAALRSDAGIPTGDLARYLDELAEGDESEWGEKERLAYWINAYNAFTLKLIVDHYPIEARWYVKVLPFLKAFLPANSILQIPGRWTEITFASVRGPITLDAIEHEILRPEFEDPRIHAAIVCASIGCPVLRDEAYVGDAIDAQLDEQFRDFVSNGRGMVLDTEGRKIEISKVFDWFREDFDVDPPDDRPRLPGSDRFDEDQGPIRWVYAYASPPVRVALEGGKWDVEHLHWDWRLNDVR
jgi:hypothetical protein